MHHRWWGNLFNDYPTALLAELNGEKRSERLVVLQKAARKVSRKKK